MCDINNLKQKLRYSKKPRTETHYQEGCCYAILEDCSISESGLGKVTILIRICKCSEYKDRSELLDRKKFALDELLDTGIEIHVATIKTCYYKITVDKGWIWNDYNFRKLCYCPSEQRSDKK